MTAMTHLPKLSHANDGAPAMRTDETYWGYILRADHRPETRTQIKQAVAGLFGLAAVAASVGFWVLPGAFFSEDVAVFKMVISFLTCAFGVFLLWYASEGSVYELQIDQSRSELREVMRNSKGQGRLQRRHLFSEIGEIFVVSDKDDDIMGSLMMRIGDTEEAIVVAHAPDHQLRSLRQRLKKDIMGAPKAEGGSRGETRVTTRSATPISATA